MDGMPSVGVFLRDPAHIYANFGGSHGKLRTDRSTSATGDMKTKDYVLTNIYFMKLYWYTFFDVNYLKCSNDFSVDCTFYEKTIKT